MFLLLMRPRLSNLFAISVMILCICSCKGSRDNAFFYCLSNSGTNPTSKGAINKQFKTKNQDPSLIWEVLSKSKIVSKLSLFKNPITSETEIQGMISNVNPTSKKEDRDTFKFLQCFFAENYGDYLILDYYFGTFETFVINKNNLKSYSFPIGRGEFIGTKSAIFNNCYVKESLFFRVNGDITCCVTTIRNNSVADTFFIVASCDLSDKYFYGDYRNCNNLKSGKLSFQNSIMLDSNCIDLGKLKFQDL